MNKPLEGLFVVELTTYWAAPSAGEFLRCLGARAVSYTHLTLPTTSRV